MAARTNSATSIERFHEVALLGMLTSGFFAMAPSLDWITAGATVTALALRALALFGWLTFQFPVAIVPWLGLIGAAFYAADTVYLSRSFSAATVHLVCYLASVKILSATSRRDFAWIGVIALLEMLAASMVAKGPGFFLFFSVFTICAVGAFASGEISRAVQLLPSQRVARSVLSLVPRRLAAVSVLLFSVTLMVTTVLFFVLPRTARAAFQRFGAPGYHLSGFASEIRLGELGVLKRNNMPVMHVRSFSGEPLPSLRWRGAALTLFDGRRWYNPTGDEEVLRVEPGGFVALEGRNRTGRELQYQVRVSPGVADTLFFAGSPKRLTIESRALLRDSNGSVRVPRVPVAGLQYAVYAVLEDPVSGDQPKEVLRENLRRRLLRTPGLDRRVAALAHEVVEGTVGAREAASAIERHLKTKYSYSLELPTEEEADPIAQFLFARKKGHCEYFASAMAVMLRDVGIPSRIATGFLNGAYNSMTGWQTLRASDAHSWVEAWIEGEGWVTFDPTPPDLGAASGDLSGFPLLSDAVGQLWLEWVVGYDLQKQSVLVAGLEKGGSTGLGQWLGKWDWRQQAKQLTVPPPWVMVVLFAGIGGWIWRGRIRWLWGIWHQKQRLRKGKLDASDATELYQSMLAVLEGRGIRKPGWVTPAEFAGMLPSSETAALVERATAVYQLSRFGRRGDAAIEMAALVPRIKRAGS